MPEYKCKECYDTGFIPVYESILPIITGLPCPHCNKDNKMSAHCVKPQQPIDIVDRLSQKAREIQLEALGEHFNPSSLLPISDLAKLLHEAGSVIQDLRSERDLILSDLKGLWEAYNLKRTYKEHP